MKAKWLNSCWLKEDTNVKKLPVVGLKPRETKKYILAF